MSLFFKRDAEERAVDGSALAAWGRGEDVGASASGLDGALSLIPVYAAVRKIADDVSTMPLQAYRKTSEGRVSLPLPRVLEDPHQGLTRVDWLNQCMTSLLLRGNAYGLRVGELGHTDQLPWLDPDRMHVDESGLVPEYYYAGRHVDPATLLHIRGLMLPGSVVGVSPIKAASMMVESGLNSQNMSRDWFRNKAMPSSHLKNNAKTLTPEQSEEVSDRLQAKLRNGRPFVTGSDWDFTQLTLSAEDAGFILHSRATATQVAAIYGIQPESIGGDSGSSMTYATEEQNSIRYVGHTLRDWFVRLETSFSNNLMPRPQYVKFNPDALLRTDIKTRTEVYEIQRRIGTISRDEIRALEDREPLPDHEGESFDPITNAAPAPKGTPA